MTSMICTRCGGTGFLNLHQVDEETLADYENTGDIDIILDWIDARANVQAAGCTCAVTKPPCRYCESSHDVSVCDCCGNGEDWFHLPGLHDLNNPDHPFPECY